MKIDIKPHTRVITEQMMNDSYDPHKEEFRWISVSDLMDLKNILENYKYHTLKEIEDIIGYGQDVFEIRNRSDVLVDIESGLRTIDNCIHHEGKIADEESPFVIKESDTKPETIVSDIKPYTFTIKLNSENEEEDKKEVDIKEEESDKKSLRDVLKDVIEAMCNKALDDEEYTWYLNKDLWEKANNIHNARNTKTDLNKKKIVKEIKWVEDRIGDDGVPKSIFIEKKANGTYEVWLIRAENEPDAIRKLKTCRTMDEALDFVEKHYIGKIYNNDN